MPDDQDAIHSDPEILGGTDDFEHEVESLKHNDDLIAFLDARAQEPMVSLEEARKRLRE